MLSLCRWVVSPASTQAGVDATSILGARCKYIEVLKYFEQRYVSLAKAVPADTYTLRPAEGVRSIIAYARMNRVVPPWRKNSGGNGKSRQKNRRPDSSFI